KTLGPTGIGALWGRRELLEKMPPCFGGGEMIREGSTENVTYREPPARFEAGTPNVAGAVGLRAALDYLERLGWEEIASHSASLRKYAYSEAERRFGDGMTFYGPTEDSERESLLAFRVKGIHPHDVASLLDADGIAVRAGHHCAQPLMTRLGVPALSRASPYVYNDRRDIDRWMASMQKAVALFAR